MKKLILTIAASSLTAPVFAHAGDHQHFSPSEIIEHLLSHPFHALVTLGLLGTAFAGFKAYKHKKQNSKS